MLLIALLLAQTAAGAPAATPEQRAAVAAEQAAVAAQKAAEAALRAVEAMERSQRPPAAAATEAARAAEASAGKAADAAQKAVAAAPPNPVIWSGTVALGLIALTGNSQTITFSTNGAFERKSPDWIWGIKTFAAYGNNTAAGGGTSTSTVTALAAGVQLRGDRRFSDALSIYLSGGVDTDHLKSIESRPFGEAGVSIIWFDEKIGDLQKSTFKTDLGFRYGHEYRFLYYGKGAPARQDGVDIVAPRVGAFYRYAISKDVIFSEDASALENLVGETRALLTSTTKLSSRLTEKVALGVGFAVNYDSAPPKDKVGTDTALTVGLEIGL